MIKVNKLFSFFIAVFSERNKKNMFSVFLPSYRNARESFGELEKAVETLSDRVATAFLVLLNFHLCFITQQYLKATFAINLVIITVKIKETLSS